MKRLIIGVAATGAACLLGCQTTTGLGSYSSQVTSPIRVAHNPNLADGEGGLLIGGTVIADFKDTLVIRDEDGFERAMRVQDDTLYRDADGDIVAREYLAPGSLVRTSFDYNDKERIAQEVIILRAGQCEPIAWPEKPTPYRDP